MPAVDLMAAPEMSIGGDRGWHTPVARCRHAIARPPLARCREDVPEHVLERDAGQLTSHGVLDALVDALHRRLDAVTDDAPLVRGGPVQREKGPGLHRLIDVEQVDRPQVARQRQPAPTPAGTPRDRRGAARPAGV